MSDTQTPRTIKKYPNRRLYDTHVSSYVTVNELRQLVMENTEFRVIDAKTGRDITHDILLQIITEQEHSRQPIFSNRFLSQLIRLYGNSTQMLFADFLQSSMTLFLQQQKQIQDRLNATTDPFQAFSHLTEQNLEMWRRMQAGLLSGKQPWTGTAATEEPPAPTAGDRRKEAD